MRNHRGGKTPPGHPCLIGTDTLQGTDTYPTKREVRKIIDPKRAFQRGIPVIVPWRVHTT